MSKICIGVGLLSVFAMPVSAAIVVVDGQTAIVTFDLAGGTPYQIDYPNGAGSPTRVWFDSAMTDPVIPFTTYAATSLGDFNADNILDARDVPGFTDAVLLGAFNAEADFDDDGNVNENDIVGFVEALIHGVPADGVILFVEGINASIAMGDAAINLYLDADQDSVFTLIDSEPATSFEFTIQPNGQIGATSEVTIAPAIYLRCQYIGTVDRRAPHTDRLSSVRYSSDEVHVRSNSTAAIIMGQGRRSGGLQTDLIPVMTGISRGRLTVHFAGGSLTSPEFDINHSGSHFRFNELEFDPHDPGGVEPGYGDSFEGITVLHVEDPNDPDLALDTLWSFHVALEVPVDENADSIAVAPATITIDLLVLDASGQSIDQITGLVLNRDDNDGDPNAINYRSDVVRPLIFIDADVPGQNFPDLHLLEVVAGSSVTVVPG